jgi:hypothetical protein
MWGTRQLWAEVVQAKLLEQSRGHPASAATRPNAARQGPQSGLQPRCDGVSRNLEIWVFASSSN